jgi:hypothetical protein
MSFPITHASWKRLRLCVQLPKQYRQKSKLGTTSLVIDMELGRIEPLLQWTRCLSCGVLRVFQPPSQLEVNLTSLCGQGAPSHTEIN